MKPLPDCVFAFTAVRPLRFRATNGVVQYLFTVSIPASRPQVPRPADLSFLLVVFPSSLANWALRNEIVSIYFYFTTTVLWVSLLSSSLAACGHPPCAEALIVR